MNLSDWKKRLLTEDFQKKLNVLYPGKAKENLPRYKHLLDLFSATYPEDIKEDIHLFSAPGRTEIGGNHTDHEHGRVLAASVDLDMIGAAVPTDDGKVSILSEGYPACTIDLTDMSVRKEEVNTTAALIRGVVRRFMDLSCPISGFRAVVTSAVLPGSGISSSAAFEVLIGNMVNGLFYGGKADPVEIAQISQYAENVYFGKPSGLMDQTASSVGNILTIDFADPSNPIVEKLDVDFDSMGYRLVIINCWASHADLTDEYTAIPVEEQEVAGFFNKKVLNEVPKEAFMERIPELRKAFGDRAVLRSLHFYADTERVPRQVEALKKGDVNTFLRLVNESGRSSWMYLQNIVPCGANKHQEMAIALALCDELLAGRGAFRVHGGGFAGTCQAFVPDDMIDSFTERMNRLLGEGSCHVLSIRPTGGCELL